MPDHHSAVELRGNGTSHHVQRDKTQPKYKKQQLEKQSLEFPLRQNDEGDTNSDIWLAGPKGSEILSHLPELQILQAQLKMR